MGKPVSLENDDRRRRKPANNFGRVAAIARACRLSIVVSAACGLVAGGVAGTMAGPSGIVAGALFGGVVGAAGGVALAIEREDERRRYRALDEPEDDFFF
jgi:hypothetical protein